MMEKQKLNQAWLTMLNLAASEDISPENRDILLKAMEYLAGQIERITWEEQTAN